MQRRIKELVLSGRVVSVGKGRATKYKIVKTNEATALGQLIELLPLSKEGKEIQDAISLPPQQRHPVGYNRSFLEKYQPNTTCYLTAEEKIRLAALGITASVNEPAGTYSKEILQRLLIDLSGIPAALKEILIHYLIPKD